MPIARDESISEATFSTGAKVLRYVLANITPDELHEGLLNALTPRSARAQHCTDLFGGTDHSIALSVADTSNLLEIFRAAGIGRAYRGTDAVNVQSMRHCVRCHCTFFEINNGLNACRVVGDVGDGVCAVCKKPVNEADFLGRHTSVAEALRVTRVPGSRSRSSTATLTSGTNIRADSARAQDGA